MDRRTGPGQSCKYRTQRDRSQTHTNAACVRQIDATAQTAAHHRAHLSASVSEPLNIMQSSPGHHERSHQTCAVAHDKEQPDSALWPGHCSARQHASFPNDDRPGPITDRRFRSPAASGRSRMGVRRTQPADQEWRKARLAWPSWHSERQSKAGFEWCGTCGHHSSQAAPTRWSAPTCGGGWCPFWRGGRLSTPEHLPGEGTARAPMSVQKQLAEPLGQLILASHPRQRCTERRRRYWRGGSAHLCLPTIGSDRFRTGTQLRRSLFSPAGVTLMVHMNLKPAVC